MLAAFVAAVGPADRARAVFSWPPADLPRESARTMWFTPLLLSARIPQSIAAEIPCTLPPPLPEATSPPIVLATARSPFRNNGLHVTRDRRQLVVSVGRRELLRAPLQKVPSGKECAYRLSIRDGQWSLEGGLSSGTRTGEMGSMPTVSGLFSELDLERGPTPSVTVQSRPYSTAATTVQTVARVASAVLLAFALGLLCLTRRPRPLVSLRALGRRAKASVDATDLAVAAGLLLWWAIAPVHYDDGWAIARQRTFAVTGGFSEYFHIFGSNIPNGYWLEWLTHWLAVRTDALLVLRLPALLCLVGVWLLCRWTLARVAPDDRAARWALASIFLLGAMAWGMTLRPEAVTALLVTGTLACAVAFHERPSVQPLVIAAVLVPLALTAHHAGLLALAPLLAIAPRIAAWVRPNPVAAMATGAASFALLLLLLFVGSDLGQRALEAQVMQAYGQQDSWFDEFQRYAALSDGRDFGMGALARRTFVAVMLLAAFSFVARRKKVFPGDLAGAALVLSLFLLALIPSKWAWHFGALIGIVATAAAVEVARLRMPGTEPRSWHMRPLIGVAVTTLAIAWAWRPAISWGWLDLARLDWATRHGLWSAIATALPLLVLALLALTARRTGRPGATAQVSTERLLPVIVAAPAIAFTVGVFVVDAVQSPWTAARQNLGALAGRAGCGLGDQLRVPDLPASEPAAPPAASGDDWAPAAPTGSPVSFALGPKGGDAPYSAWMPIRDRRPVGFYVTESATLALLRVQWGRTSGDTITVAASGLVRSQAASFEGQGPWHFIGWNELPNRPPDADVVRVGLDEASPAGIAVAVSGPVAYQPTPVRVLIEAGNGTVLSAPPLVTYLPCADLPRLEAVVEAPDLILSTVPSPDPSLAVGFPTSPFRGVSDIYRLVRLPFDAPLRRPANLRIYRVDSRIPGAALAPAMRTDIVS